ncbi:hypothetical protein Acr_11g0000870 [Actinidia rufa]|uniref:RING-type domain-containing protein n=1 Tax=Actinidia rufa TaxID=165716 RepID=A0A7J0FAT9_9ERIC|nr:hypothetical protein Acr_11g0000870 [Actinidia rufa]
MGLQDPHPFNFADLKDKNLQIDTKTLILGVIFLLLLLISIFCFMYFLYACIRRRQSPAIGPVAGMGAPSTGLDKATISCLPIVSYGPGQSSLVGECSICLGAFEEGEKVKVLPLCHHGFHAGCVDTWLLSRPSCPLCRAAVVRVDSVAWPDMPCGHEAA